MVELLADTLRRPNFLAFVALFLCGLFIAITHHNLIKKVIGLYVIQTSVLFILVTFSYKQGATVPILVPGEEQVDARAYVNPLPHALTLTGIVVGVATLGVALSLVDLDLPALRQPGRRRDPRAARMTRHLPVLVYLIPLLAGIAMPAVAVRRPPWCRPIALWAAVLMSLTAIATAAAS